MLPMLVVLAMPASSPLWTQNHSSQVKSFASRMVDGSDGGGAAVPLVAAGSEYTSDQDVSALHARTGKAFWSSTAMQEWTYGVALQPQLPADPSRPAIGLVAFGCPFFASGIPPPCVLGFWKDATDGNLTWKAPLDGATLSAAHGPPGVFFSADGSQILALYTQPGADPSAPPIEYLAVVSSADGTVVATHELGAGTGHGVHVQQPNPLAPPPATTNALVSLPGSSSTNVSSPGRVEFHFALSLDKDGLHPNNTPLIDCNGTSSCAFLAASSDLTMVVVDSVPISNDPPSPTQVCSFLTTDAERWGFALYRGAGVSSSSPQPYATQWAVCAKPNQKPTKERRALNSVTIVANSSRVVAVFSHLVQGTTTSNGVSACAYDIESGSEVWCTQKTEITPPSPTAISPVVASHDDGLVVVGVPGVGLLGVDANPAASAPTKMKVIYSQGKADDCCGATAIEVVGATGEAKTVVASIPVGTVSGIWCQCQHSTLMGVAVPATLF